VRNDTESKHHIMKSVLPNKRLNVVGLNRVRLRMHAWQIGITLGAALAWNTRTGGDKAKRDANFQCFGRFITGSTGEYLFRTIKPVPYPGRAPHIHLAVKLKGKKELISQCYIKGHAGNEKDFIWKGIKDAKQRENVTVDFAPLKGSKAGELAATWDVVMGLTPGEA
jgi:hypothetical protein